MSQMAIQTAGILAWARRELVKLDSLSSRQDMERFAAIVLGKMRQQLGMALLEGSIEAYQDGIEHGGVDLALAHHMVNPEVIRGLAKNSPIWDSYAGLTNELSGKVNRYIAASHLQDGGHDPAALARALDQAFGFATWRSDTIARTETQALHVAGREQAWRELDPEGRWRYKWGGPFDRRTSEACWWVRQHVPSDGLALGELAQLVEQAREKFYPRLRPRRFQCHPNERHEPQKIPRMIKRTVDIPYSPRLPQEGLAGAPT